MREMTNVLRVLPLAPSSSASTHPTNVGNAERWVASLLGGALLSYGVRAGRYKTPLGIGILLVAGHQIYRSITGYDRIYAQIGVDTSEWGQFGPTEPMAAMPVSVEKVVTVNASQEDVFAFWRDFEHLPRFMEHLEIVRTLDDRRSHWVAKAPLGTTVEWDAEIIEERANELIAWRSLPGADIPNKGRVEFKPAAGDRGTEVHVRLEYSPPVGHVGALIAKLFGEEPDLQVAGDLRRLKQVLEAGEVATTEGQPQGE